MKHLYHYFSLVLFFVITAKSFAQTSAYTTANLHAHNDYEKSNPFWNAYNNRFGSIEVDIFLVDSMLLVAHEVKQLTKDRTLQGMYLEPIETLLKKHKGFPSTDTGYKFQLMIDVKSEAVATLNALIKLLQELPGIINSKSVSIVISGNRPPIDQFTGYPEYILFDGLPKLSYTNQLRRIPMFSDNFKLHSKWNGEGSIPEEDKQRLQSVIKHIHSIGKKIRFWNAPDNPAAWKELMSLGVDYINTDRVKEAAEFVENYGEGKN
jgi:alkaline phosphatase